MSSLHSLMDILSRLRAPDGCPWDRKQTHESLKPNFLEETYEVMDAIDAQDPRKLREELGDVLLQVAFHAQIAQENGDFTIDDVVGDLCEKLIRRHPHVFADESAETVQDVLHHWEAVNTLEREEGSTPEAPVSLFASIPRQLPALIRATKIQKRAARVGFDWPDVAGPMAKVEEEWLEFQGALASGEQERIREEFGDVLFSLVNVARFTDFESELALDDTNQRFLARFAVMESMAKEENLIMKDLSLEELDALWRRAKVQLQST